MSSSVAVDLGCGHGLQSVALARRGYRVIAIDTCPLLLRQLEVRAASLPVQTIQVDIRNCSSDEQSFDHGGTHQMYPNRGGKAITTIAAHTA